MKSYKIDPASTNTFGSTTLDSLNSFSINRQSEVTVMGSDGKPHQQLAAVSNIYSEVSVTGKDVNIDITPGDTGSLVLKAIQQETGSGTTGTAITFTFANSTLGSIDRTVNHSGESEVTYNFTCVSADGTTEELAIT